MKDWNIRSVNTIDELKSQLNRVERSGETVALVIPGWNINVAHIIHYHEMTDAELEAAKREEARRRREQEEIRQNQELARQKKAG